LNPNLSNQLKPSPKGGGFLFVGIRKKDGTERLGFCLEKGCMTLIVVGEIQTKFNTKEKQGCYGETPDKIHDTEPMVHPLLQSVDNLWKTFLWKRLWVIHLSLYLCSLKPNLL